MSGDKNKKKGKVAARSNEEPETHKKGDAGDDGDDVVESPSPAVLASLRNVVSEVMAEGMMDLKLEMKKELSQVRLSLLDDMKAHMDKLTTEINQKVKVATDMIEEVAGRLGGVEESMAGREEWDNVVGDTLIQLLNNQKSLQAKISDLEGRSRRNNIRIYGIPENAEGTSMVCFVENLIQSELGDIMISCADKSLGIERAHRSLGPQPPPGAPPRSTVVRFSRFIVKEKVLQAAWKKNIRVKERRVFFDHDYAEAVQRKRKEYIPIKHALKGKGIRFQTPLTRMRVHFDSGTVTYGSAEEAAADLNKRGFTVGPIPTSRSRDITMETINKLRPWSTARMRRSGSAHDYQESIREKLRGFQRLPREDTGMAE